MSTKSGGGPSRISNLTERQRKLARKLFSTISAELDNPSRSDVPLISEAEQKTFDELISAIGREDLVGKQLGKTDAIRELLNPNTAFEPISETAALNAFSKNVANPLIKEFSEKLAPQIRRGFQGFSSRAGRAVERGVEDLSSILAGKLAQTQFETQKLNAQLGLQAAAMDQQSRSAGLQLLPGITGAETSALSRTLALQEGLNNKRRAESESLLPLNNPAIDRAFQFINTQQAQVVNKPPSNTFFGDVLEGTNAVAGTIGNIQTLFKPQPGSNTTNTGNVSQADYNAFFNLT